jgi:hypothetical protein
MMNNGWVFVRPEAVDTICAPAFAIEGILPQQLHERGMINYATFNHDQGYIVSLPEGVNTVHYDYPQDIG